MQCLKPTQAWHDGFNESGSPRIVFKYDSTWILHPEKGLVNKYLAPVREVLIPCGKCLVCRKNRGFEIGIRARCESVLHLQSCFITLTVSDENMETVFPGNKLRHRPWQLFAKKLRKEVGPFRFIMCGEYGEHTHRPHYHAIIFGHHFNDSFFDSRGCFHASKMLERLWKFGNISVSRLNDNRVMYVAGYVLKGSDDYPSYVKWSRRPGLGALWIDKFCKTVYRRDGYDFGCQADKVVSAVIWHNRLTPFACRYFDSRLRLHDERLYGMMKAYRLAKVGSSSDGLSHSPVVMDFLLKGLENRVDRLKYRLASRTRDLHNRDYAPVKEFHDARYSEAVEEEMLDDYLSSIGS